MYVVVLVRVLGNSCRVGRFVVLLNGRVLKSDLPIAQGSGGHRLIIRPELLEVVSNAVPDNANDLSGNKNPEKSPDIRALEDKAMQILGLSLSLSWDEAKERGKLSISMSSLEQLDDLMARLGLADDNPS